METADTHQMRHARGNETGVDIFGKVIIAKHRRRHQRRSIIAKTTGTYRPCYSVGALRKDCRRR